MRKKWLFLMLSIVLCFALAFSLSACGKDEGGEQNPQEEEGLLTIAGVSFEDKTVDYSGSEQSITVSGLPEDASVAYTANTGTNAGVYDATAVITKEGYKTLTLQATLTINKLTFTGVTFQNVSVVYDNNEHTISVAGIPNFANVTYTGTRTAKNAGTYNSTAKVTADNYHDLTLTATLTISKATLGDFTFNSSTFEYDTQKHIISISGLVPSGETVVYSGGEDGANGATNVGTYTITAVIGGKNYLTKTVSATLKIKSKEEPLATIIYAGDVYFQNALDNNKLYVYNGSEVEKVNNDIPGSFVTNGDSLYYLTKNLFTKGITSYDGTSSKDLFTVSGEYLVSDGINVFYSVTNILKPSVNGIYRLALADLNNQSEDPVATRVCEIKAEYLTIINGYIYFTNNSDSGKLYRIDSSVTEGIPEKVYDYKVSDLTASGNILYFTRHITLTNLTPGAAIYSIDAANLDTLPISEEEEGVVTKITNSKGKYITVVGEYVYFVNTDLITSTIFGNGIYKAKADGSDWLDNVIGGTKVINAEDNNVYALSTDGVNLYYYRANDKHLYCYDGSDEVDLMEGFVPPEETVLITTYYAEMKEYNNELYYIKMTDGGKLYKYNIESGQETRVTNLEVADFAINDGILYYATVRFKVNFDLYKMDLVTGENTRISTEKCMHFAFDENYLYYGSFTDNNTLNRMNFDGTEVEILFDTKSVDDYDIYALNGKIYFVADGDMYCYDTEADLASIVNDEANPNEFIVIDGSAYLMQDSWSNSFSKLDLATGELTQIDDLGMTNDARSFFVIGNYIYYYRNVAVGSKYKGLYKIDMTSSEPQGTLVTDLDDGDTSFYMSSAVAIGQKVYFLDVWQVKNSIPTPQSTASLCVLDLTDNTVTVLAE